MMCGKHFYGCFFFFFEKREILQKNPVSNIIIYIHGFLSLTWPHKLNHKTLPPQKKKKNPDESEIVFTVID